MRVTYEDIVYEFDPGRLNKPILLNRIAENKYLPIPLKWRVWLTVQAIKKKGILVKVIDKGA